MKPIHLITALPILAIAAGACEHAHPNSDGPSPNDVATSPAPGPPPGPQPSFGPLVQQKDSPPPISGGTLAVAPDRVTAVAADPDRDRVYVVDVPGRAVRHTIELPRHSEPGRVSFDDAGHAYVILRRAGGMATIDIATGAVSFRDVCIAPRGLAFDKDQNAVQVACASGEFVTLPLGGGDIQRLQLDRDLRDVLSFSNGSLAVTTFRTATTTIVRQPRTPLRPQPVPQVLPLGENGNLAWRAVVTKPSEGCADGSCSEDTATVIQAPTEEPVNPAPGGYSAGGTADSSCEATAGIIATRLRLGRRSVRVPTAVLPVDLATNGRELAVVAAGNGFTKGLPQIFVVFADQVRGSVADCVPTTHGTVPGQAIAAAFDSEDALLVQTREPAALHIMTEDRRRPWKTIVLATDSVADSGHAIFHSNAGGFIACASCHAEGADDGHVWNFLGAGPRRTPSLLGTIAGTEPFHWDGDMKDLRDLVDHVFVERMSGPNVDDAELGALGGWLFALPAPAKLRAESDATVRGGTLFTQRCSSCHSGAMLTNNRSFDVGTGGTFQVPSLVGVGWRRPLLHTGCAMTLADRFDPRCGGASHGDTADLGAEQISDLVKFLETL
jgi:mono/diheme cytochrome c family protein